MNYKGVNVQQGRAQQKQNMMEQREVERFYANGLNSIANNLRALLAQVQKEQAEAQAQAQGGE